MILPLPTTTTTTTTTNDNITNNNTNNTNANTRTTKTNCAGLRARRWEGPARLPAIPPISGRVGAMIIMITHISELHK